MLVGCITGCIRFAPEVTVTPAGKVILVVVASDAEATVAAAARRPQPVTIVGGRVTVEPGSELGKVAATELLDWSVTPGIGACALSCTACICLFKTDLWVHE